MDISLLIVIVTTSLIAICEGHGTALTFELPDNDKICFAERFKKAQRYFLEYRVLRGGNNDVDAWIMSPNGLKIYSKQKSPKDTVAFDVSRGEFKFCFGNEFSAFSHKVIYFNLKPESMDNLAVEAGDTKPTVKTAAEMFCEHIHESMTSVVNFQKDYRLRESVGRHIAEIILDRVSIWSIGQACVILIIGFGQVFILKTFFTEKRIKKEGI